MKTRAYQSFITAEGTGGNPAGVALREHRTDDDMQKEARRMQMSETAFIEKMAGGYKHDTYQVLFYTPTHRVELCGHATIAAAAYLFGEGKVSGGHEYTQQYVLEGGQIRETHVRHQDDRYYYGQYVPPGHAPIDPAEMLPELGLHEQDLDELFYPRSVYTDALIAVAPEVFDQTPLPDQLDYKHIRRWLETRNLQGVHLFARGEPDSGITARCRNFAPAVGIDEESATGSACGILARELWLQGLLVREQLDDLLFVQGEHLGERSEIFARVDRSTDEVEVGGRAREV